MGRWENLSKKRRNCVNTFNGAGLLALIGVALEPANISPSVFLIVCGSVMTVAAKMLEVARRKQDGLLSPAEIAKLRQLIYKSQLELNRLMRRKYVLHADEVYNKINELHDLFNSLRNRLNEEGDINRADFVGQIERLRQELRVADQAARKAASVKSRRR